MLKEFERGIANLDRWQKQAAIETPEGPQRIRGLAGSGKTIVLALKAAYLHAQHPDWRIGVCFFSRALYQQFEDLTTRFTFEHSNDKPDFERLQLLHAWGGAGRNGFYRTIAAELGAPVRDWQYANATWGRDGAFRGACGELLHIAEGSAVAPVFDVVLVERHRIFRRNSSSSFTDSRRTPSGSSGPMMNCRTSPNQLCLRPLNFSEWTMMARVSLASIAQTARQGETSSFRFATAIRRGPSPQLTPSGSGSTAPKGSFSTSMTSISGSRLATSA